MDYPGSPQCHHMYPCRREGQRRLLHTEEKPWEGGGRDENDRVQVREGLSHQQLRGRPCQGLSQRSAQGLGMREPERGVLDREMAVLRKRLHFRDGATLCNGDILWGPVSPGCSDAELRR